MQTAKAKATTTVGVENHDVDDDDAASSSSSSSSSSGVPLSSLLAQLPSYDYAHAVNRIINSLVESALANDVFMFTVRITPILDENDQILGRSVLSLEKIESYHENMVRNSE